jgi:hypothetical protein
MLPIHGSCILLVASIALVASATNGQGTRKVREDLRIGDRLEDTLYVGAHIVTALRDGGVAVGNFKDGHLLFYNAQGKLLRQIGGLGSGPGEFHWLSNAGVRGDSFWVSDGAQGRITVFDSHGKVARTVTIPVAGRGALLADGTVAIIPELVYARPPRPILVTHVNSVGDSVNAFQVGYYRPRTMVLRDGSGKEPPLLTWQYWDDTPIVVAAGDGSGVVIVDRTINPGRPAFTVTRYKADSSAGFRKSFPYVPRAVKKADIDSLESMHWESGRAEPPLDETWKMVRHASRRRWRKELWIPPHMLPVTAVIPAGDGSIWIGRDHNQGSRRWVSITPRGDVNFEIVLPSRVELRAAFDRTVWCSTINANGEEILVRYRIE